MIHLESWSLRSPFAHPWSLLSLGVLKEGICLKTLSEDEKSCDFGDLSLSKSGHSESSENAIFSRLPLVVLGKFHWYRFFHKNDESIWP